MMTHDSRPGGPNLIRPTIYPGRRKGSAKTICAPSGAAEVRAGGGCTDGPLRMNNAWRQYQKFCGYRVVQGHWRGRVAAKLSAPDSEA